MKKIISVILVVTLLAVGTIGVFANVDDSEDGKVATGRMQRRQGKGFDFGAFFKGLVDDNTITEEQKELIEEKMEARKAEFGVDRGVDKEAKLESLVEDGIFTQAELDAVIAYFDECKAAGESDREAHKAAVAEMTQEERAEYFANQEKVDPVDEMLEKGIITDEQAEALKGLIGNRRDKRMNNMPGEGRKMMPNEQMRQKGGRGNVAPETTGNEGI